MWIVDAYSFDLIVYWLGLGIFKLILVTSVRFYSLFSNGYIEFRDLLNGRNVALGIAYILFITSL